MPSSRNSALRTFAPWLFFLMLVFALSQIKIDFGSLIIFVLLGFLLLVVMFYGRIAVSFYNVVVRGK